MITTFHYIRWALGVFILILGLASFIQNRIPEGFFLSSVGLLCIPPITRFVFPRREITSIDKSQAFHSPTGYANKILSLIEVNKDVDLVEMIDKVLLDEDKSLNEKYRKAIGMSIYSRVIEFFLEDRIITATEKANLNKIKQHFLLRDEDVLKIHSSINKRVLKNVFIGYYEKGYLTDKEKEEIADTAKFLDINPKVFQEIRKAVVGPLFISNIENTLAKKELSPSDESRLKKLFVNLEIGKDIRESGLSKRSLNKLVFHKKMWRAGNGYLTPLSNISLGLQRGEECYLAFSARLVRSEVVTKGYKSVSQGYSVPIFKGVRYNIGETYSTAIREHIKVVNPGDIYLTNKRIIFISGAESFDINMEKGKLLCFYEYSNGVEFVISGWAYSIKFGSSMGNFFSENESIKVFCATLTSCLRYIQDPNDPIYQLALKEVEGNEELIEI